MSQQVTDHVRNTSLFDSASIGYTVSELCQTCEAFCCVSQDATRTLLLTLRSNLETLERHVEKLMAVLSRAVPVGSTVSPTLLLSAVPSRHAHFRWSTVLNRDHNSTRIPPEKKIMKFATGEGKLRNLGRSLLSRLFWVSDWS